ncbi:MAG TPA: multicopper oxidase domain-containing protein [Anaerolineae bacterium]|nr:multicopper oxidase domain-containing protein [Anaerolineae bacterium]
MNKIRRYLILAGVSLLIVALAAFAVGGHSRAQAASLGEASARQAAVPLPTATCTLVGSTRTCELWAKAGSMALPGPVIVPIWGFADTAAGAAQLPGPVLIGNEGETLEVILHNDLAGEAVALAFPGLENWQPDLVGATSGASTTYSIQLSNVGTYLYEAGLTMNGTRQIAMGLFGALIVRPAGAPTQAYPDAATTFGSEALLVLSEIDPAFNANPNSFKLENLKPKYWLINGKVYPETEPIDALAGSTLLLRYVNASSRHHAMGLLGQQQTVVAADGVPFTYPRTAVAEVVWPGQSVDSLVQIPASALAGARYPLYETGLYLHNAGRRLLPGGPTAFGGMLTFIQVGTGGAPTDTGPVASGVAVAPTRTTGASGVTLSATLDDSATGIAENVIAAEYFIGASVAPGAGTPLAVTPGVAVNVSVAIPASDLLAWASGNYTFYVRGQDASGDWGATGSAVLKLDKTGPATTGMSLTPNPVNSAAVNIQATGDESATGGGTVVAATYTIAGGAAQPLALNGAAAPVRSLTATIPQLTVAALAEGQHTISIISQDDLGNLGTPGVITLLVDRSGPAANNVVVTPATLSLVGTPSATSIRVTASIQDVLASGIQSNLTTAEVFINAAGAPGTGAAMFPSDGLFNEISEAVYLNIPVSSFTQLSRGPHPIYVHGKDTAGNWGALGSGTITIDRGTAADTSGPNVTSLAAAPNPFLTATSVALTALASDVGNMSNVTAAEWYFGADPGRGLGTAMQATDGAFDSTVENIAATINVTGWPATRTVFVRARDAAGNWSAVASVLIERGFVDTTGPNVTALTAAPNPTNGAASVTLAATATDPAAGGPASNIAAAEWFEGVDPGAGLATAMTATDGAFNSPSEAIGATINVSAWTPGNHTVSVRARDAAGNWGGLATTVVAVTTPSTVYFSTFGNTNPPGVGGTADDADIYLWNGAAFSRVFDVTIAGNVDGLDVVDATHFYLSFVDNATVPGLGTVQDEDVVYYNAGTWSVYFDGTARGLTAGNQDVDAFDIP